MLLNLRVVISDSDSESGALFVPVLHLVQVLKDLDILIHFGVVLDIAIQLDFLLD